MERLLKELVIYDILLTQQHKYPLPLIIVKDYYRMPTAVLIACFRHEYADEVGALLAASTLQTILWLLFLLSLERIL